MMKVKEVLLGEGPSRRRSIPLCRPRHWVEMGTTGGQEDGWGVRPQPMAQLSHSLACGPCKGCLTHHTAPSDLALKLNDSRGILGLKGPG